MPSSTVAVLDICESCAHCFVRSLLVVSARVASSTFASVVAILHHNMHMCMAVWPRMAGWC